MGVKKDNDRLRRELEVMRVECDKASGPSTLTLE
jgi:hypothetical protein